MNRITVVSKYDLDREINKAICENGIRADLNYIDTSLITDMSWIFNGSRFKGKIDQWDTSNVIDMSYMFCDSWFDKDISSWNTGNVKNMSWMFAVVILTIISVNGIPEM